MSALRSVRGVLSLWRLTRLTALLLLLLLASCGEDMAPQDEAGDDEGSSQAAGAAHARVPPWAKVAPEQLAEAEKHGVPVAFENDLGMRFVLIPAGTFRMGSWPDDVERDEDEFQHEEIVPAPFYLQVTEATKGQYLLFDPWYDHPKLSGWRAPIEDGDPERLPACVGHLGGRHFATWLSAVDDQRDYRLPTEVEWEYACRAGTQTPYWWGSNPEDAARYENLDQAGRRDPEDGFLWIAPVGRFPANPWGLHDMAGNVSEACVNWYEPYPGADEQARFRHEVVTRTRKGHAVRRGGSYRDRVVFARSAWRDTTSPRLRPALHTIGFRLVSPLPGTGE